MKPIPRPRLWLLAAAAWLLTTGGGTVPARGDVIGEWNAQAMTAVRGEDLLAPESARNLAMLHAAIYNAVEGIAGDYTLFTAAGYAGPSGSAADGASMEAAVAAAAFTILQGLHPGLSGDFATVYSSQLSGIADSQG